VIGEVARISPLRLGTHENEWGETVVVSSRTIASVRLSRGKVVVGDPFIGSINPRPLDIVVQPGTYQVDLTLVSLSDDTRVAFATMHLRPVVRISRVPATLDGRALAFAVDSGNAMFSSPEACLEFGRRRGADELLARLAESNANTWSCADIDLGAAGNMVVFSAGLGSGRYASYWCIDDTGDPAGLVIDFDIAGAFGIEHALA
jgi:hypothetical protein